MTSIEAAEQAVAAAKAEEETAFAAHWAADCAYRAAQGRRAAAERTLQLAQRGKPLHRQTIASVLKRAGFEQGAVERGRVTTWREGFGVNQLDDWSVGVQHYTPWSYESAVRQENAARDAQMLLRYEATITEAGYAVEKSLRQGELRVTRPPAPPPAAEREE